jgi:hypothetical protein
MILLAFPWAERVDTLQWEETQKALVIGDAIAQVLYRMPTTGDLPPEAADQCRKLGAHCLRSAQASWVEVARDYAVEQMADAMREGSEMRFWSRSKRETVARLLLAVALDTYHGITDGSIVLPADLYRRIQGGQR